MDSPATGRTVLVVDDHDPWRRQVLSLIEKSGLWQVCGQASNGEEAVAQAAALRPSLIVLDVELPRMSGIEATRRILAGNPDVRILFLSGHSNLDIVAAALAAGGRGYVVKTDAGHELLTAMEAIHAGKRFLGALLTGRGRDAQDDPDSLRRRHEMGVYPDSLCLVEGLARFAREALDAGKSVIVFVADARAEQLLQQLRADGVEIDVAVRQGRYRQLDVERALADYVINGRADHARFWQAATANVLEAAKAAIDPHRVAICGEGASRLFHAHPDVALQVEQWWDELASAYNVDVFCAHEAADGLSPALQQIRDLHSKVYSA